MALVRTESLDAGWGASHGFRSWDAHVLFDCNGGRMRVIRSATYPEANRKGAPTSERREDGWTTPQPREPAARLFAAACDVTYAWPLRPQLRIAAVAPTPAPTPTTAPSPPAPTPPAQVKPEPQPLAVAQAAPAVQAPAIVRAAPTTPALPTAVAQAASNKPAAPPVQSPASRPTQRLAIQIGRGPFEAGARKALKKARETLGPAADGLADVTEVSWHGRKRRFTALLSGFASADAARAACETLAKAGQTCLTRRAPDAGRPALARAATPASAAEGRYFVQVAHGPFEQGAKRALRKARLTLGPAAANLTAVTETSRLRRRRRYAAVLTGFPSAAEAAEACRTLARAGQGCLTRVADASPGRERRLVLAQLW
jgi:hypothetical protein